MVIIVLLVWVVFSVVLNTQLAVRRRRDTAPCVVDAIMFGVLSTRVLLAAPMGRSRLCDACRMRIPDNARRCPHCHTDQPFGVPSLTSG